MQEMIRLCRILQLRPLAVLVQKLQNLNILGGILWIKISQFMKEIN